MVWFLAERQTWLGCIGADCLNQLPVADDLRMQLSALLPDMRLFNLWEREEDQEDQIDQLEVEALLAAENTEVDDYLTDLLALPAEDEVNNESEGFLF